MENEINKIINILPHTYIVVGKYIRGVKTKEIEIVTTDTIPNVINFFENLGDVYIIKSGNRQAKIELKYNNKYIKIVIYHVKNNEVLYSILTYSYPRDFIIILRTKAKQMGYLLNQYGMYNKNDKLIHIKTIEDIFKKLKVLYRTPYEQEQLMSKKYNDIGDTKEAIRQIRQEKIRNEIGNGLGNKLINTYRKKYCGDKSVQLKNGEKHFLCANYMGPGTNILDIERDPINNSDMYAQIHDYQYDIINNNIPKEERPKFIRKADNKFIENLNKTNDGIYTEVGKKSIKLKIAFEDLLPRFAKIIEGEKYGEK